MRRKMNSALLQSNQIYSTSVDQQLLHSIFFLVLSGTLPHRKSDNMLFAIYIREKMKTHNSPISNLQPTTVFNLYWKEKDSLPKIGKKFKINNGSLYRWMKKHNIPIRSKQEAGLLRRKFKLTPNELNKLYWKKKLSAREIGDLYGITEEAVLWHMRKYNIPRRALSEAIFVSRKIKRPSRNKLYRLYHIEQKSITQVAKELNISPSYVRKLLIKYKIARRDRAEACRKYKRTPFSGNKDEKAYMLRFCIGDVYACKRYQTVVVNTTTTHLAMIKLFYRLFGRYGHCSKSPRKENLTYQWSLLCSLDSSFEFIVKEKYRKPSDKSFYPFLAGYSDAEGCWMIRKSHSNSVSFAFEIQTQDMDLLKHIKSKLEKRGYHPTFGLKSLKQKKGRKCYEIPLNKNMYYLRILRRNEILSLIRKLRPYTKHQEKIDKMKFILNVGKEISWKKIKSRVETLRNEIKEEVRELKQLGEEEFKKRGLMKNKKKINYKKIRLKAGLESH